MIELDQKRLHTKRLVALTGVLALTLSACGGGNGGGASQATTYNLQAGAANLVAEGFNINVNLSGSVTVDGTAVPVTGTGTLDLAPGAATTFAGAAASSQAQTLTATITADGESEPLSTSVTNYYATGTSDLLGQTATGSYSVASTPIAYPDSVVAGSSGTLGTFNQYTDSTMSTPVGTSQLTYVATAGAPLSVQITTKVYDTMNNLQETDVVTYSLSASNVLTFVSQSGQTASGTVTITAQ